MSNVLSPVQPAEPVVPVRLPIKRLLLTLGIVATLYAAALLVWGHGPRVSIAQLLSWAGLQAGALCLLSYALRGWRWRLWMAHYGCQFGPLQGLRLYLAGYAFTPTPGNIGEAMRGLMLAKNPLGTARSLAIFGAERLADLLCLLLLCLPAFWWVATQGALLAAPVWLWWLLAGALALALLLLAGLARFRVALMRRLPWLHEAARCMATRPLVWLGLTLTAWAAQGVAVWLVCRELGFDLSVLTATGYYAVAMVAGALSALPAGLGGTEAVLTGLLVVHGAGAGQALTITVLVRLLTLWLAVAIGLIALVYSAAISREISLR